MEVFFADDACTNGAREGMGKLMAFGGLLLDESALRPVEKAVAEILSEYGAPIDTEIKWSLKPDSWIRMNLFEEDRTNLYRRVLSVARENEGRSVVVIWDTGRTTLNEREAFPRCVNFAFERITWHLSKSDRYCVVVADRPGGGKKEEEAFLSCFLDAVQHGTEFVPPDRVLLNVLTTPSHLVRQLQLADLICSVTTAMVAGYYKYAKPVFEEIKPMFITNFLGYVGGSGLKLFPDDLINLYHWVLGEKAYTKASMMTGWGLPMKEYPYFEGDH